MVVLDLKRGPVQEWYLCKKVRIREKAINNNRYFDLYRIVYQIFGMKDDCIILLLQVNSVWSVIRSNSDLCVRSIEKILNLMNALNVCLPLLYAQGKSSHLEGTKVQQMSSQALTPQLYDVLNSFMDLNSDFPHLKMKNNIIHLQGN